MKKHRSEVLVGVAVILGLGLAVGGTLWLADAPLGVERMTVRARFQQVGQLSRGNPVKLRGVPIGRVTDVSLEPSGAGVIVAMTIDEGVALPDDPVVLLAPQSMFGDWQAQILPRSRYPGYSYSESPDPQVLPGASMPDVSEITAVADRIAENLAVLTDRVEIAFTEETALNIRRAIQNIQAVSNELTGVVTSQRQAVEELTAELEQTTRTLGEAATHARHSFAQVDSAVSRGQLRAIVGNVERATSQADSLSRVLLTTSEEFRSTVASAERGFGAVESIASEMNTGDGTMARLVRDTTLYTDMVRTNLMLQQVLMDFQENPGRYIKLEIF